MDLRPVSADVDSRNSLARGSTRENLPLDSTRQERERLANAISLLSSGGRGIMSTWGGSTSVGANNGAREVEGGVLTSQCAGSKDSVHRQAMKSTMSGAGTNAGANDDGPGDLTDLLLQSIGDSGSLPPVLPYLVPTVTAPSQKFVPAVPPSVNGGSSTQLTPLDEEVEYENCGHSKVANGCAPGESDGANQPSSNSEISVMNNFRESAPLPAAQVQKSTFHQKSPPAATAMLLDGTAWHEVEAMPIRDPISNQLVSITN